MGTTWVLAAIVAAVVGFVFGRGREDARTNGDSTGAPDLSPPWPEGLAPGSDGGSDDTRPTALAPAPSGRPDPNA